jgi:hypothetical protein
MPCAAVADNRGDRKGLGGLLFDQRANDRTMRVSIFLSELFDWSDGGFKTIDFLEKDNAFLLGRPF